MNSFLHITPKGFSPPVEVRSQETLIFHLSDSNFHVVERAHKNQLSKV